MTTVCVSAVGRQDRQGPAPRCERANVGAELHAASFDLVLRRVPTALARFSIIVRVKHDWHWLARRLLKGGGAPNARSFVVSVARRNPGGINRMYIVFWKVSSVFGGLKRKIWSSPKVGEHSNRVLHCPHDGAHFLGCLCRFDGSCRCLVLKERIQGLLVSPPPRPGRRKIRAGGKGRQKVAVTLVKVHNLSHCFWIVEVCLPKMNTLTHLVFVGQIVSVASVSSSGPRHKRQTRSVKERYALGAPCRLANSFE